MIEYQTDRRGWEISNLCAFSLLALRSISTLSVDLSVISQNKIIKKYVILQKTDRKKRVF